MSQSLGLGSSWVVWPLIWLRSHTDACTQTYTQTYPHIHTAHTLYPTWDLRVMGGGELQPEDREAEER
jgi:hypothetical protein